MSRYCVCWLLLIIHCSTASAKQPNILFAIADDWGWPHAGGLWRSRCQDTHVRPVGGRRGYSSNMPLSPHLPALPPGVRSSLVNGIGDWKGPAIYGASSRTSSPLTKTSFASQATPPDTPGRRGDRVVQKPPRASWPVSDTRAFRNL